MLVADPAMTSAFEAIAGGRPGPPGEGGLELRVRRARARREGSAHNAGGTAGASSAADIAALLGAIVAGGVSRPVGRELLERHLADGTPAAALLADAGPGRSPTTGAARHVDAVIAANPRAVDDYRAGKPVAGFFVGQVMKATGGAADAARVTQLVRQRLDVED